MIFITEQTGKYYCKDTGNCVYVEKWQEIYRFHGKGINKAIILPDKVKDNEYLKMRSVEKILDC